MLFIYFYLVNDILEKHREGQGCILQFIEAAVNQSLILE